MLLANLKKRKKVTLFGSFQQHTKRGLDYNSTSDSSNQEEITKNAKTDVYMDNPSTSNTAPSSLAVLAGSGPIPFILKFPT